MYATVIYLIVYSDHSLSVSHCICLEIPGLISPPPFCDPYHHLTHPDHSYTNAPYYGTYYGGFYPQYYSGVEYDGGEDEGAQ